MIKKIAAEFIGTFFLVLSVGAALNAGGGLGPSCGVAALLMSLIYAGKHASGAHYNPAVTLAVIVRGACSSRDAAPYIGAQLSAAIAAAKTAQMLLPSTGAVQAVVVGDAALAAEALFTFALVFVILNVATVKTTEGNSFYGAAIAGVVLAGAILVGPLSGAYFNPAVTLAGALMGGLPWSEIGFYIGVQLLAAVSAAWVFRWSYSIKE